MSTYYHSIGVRMYHNQCICILSIHDYYYRSIEKSNTEKKYRKQIDIPLLAAGHTIDRGARQVLIAISYLFIYFIIFDISALAANYHYYLNNI